MSAFNALVPLTEDHWSLVDLFDWDRTVGRIRYAWLSNDGKQGYILFKDGPSSWSDQIEAVRKQIESHPAFVCYEVLQRDSVYVKATFDLSRTRAYDPDMIAVILEADKAVGEAVKNHITFTDDPFEIFDRNIKAMNDGTLREDLKKNVEAIAKKVEDALKDNKGGIIEI